jgi:hypothetical protein
VHPTASGRGKNCCSAPNGTFIEPQKGWATASPGSVAEEGMHHKMPIETEQWERRTRCRFGIRRELRYKLVKGRRVLAAGAGHTIDVGSGGVAFSADHELEPGAAVEFSINWPALLDRTCPIRLVVFGRVLRGAGRTAVCTVDKHEFRTARASRADAWAPPVAMPGRWAGALGAAGD